MSVEENEIDRQVFAKQASRVPSPSPSLGGLLLFAAGMGLIGFLAYKYVEANGMPALGAGESDLDAVVRKLEEIEQRLDRLEKRRAPAAAEPIASASASTTADPSSSPGLPTGSTASPSGRRGGSSASGNPPYDKRLAGLERDQRSLEDHVASNREAWEASTDRIGSTVQELGTQRGELARQRESLSRLMEHFERTPLLFDLKKSMGRQRVGPVWLWLRSTDHKAGRYTLRVIADDKSIEMKDRALREPVEFYLTNGTVPLALVVNEIYPDRIVGTLAVPEESLHR
jgi:hypothetical protein